MVEYKFYRSIITVDDNVLTIHRKIAVGMPKELPIPLSAIRGAYFVPAGTVANGRLKIVTNDDDAISVQSQTKSATDAQVVMFLKKHASVAEGLYSWLVELGQFNGADLPVVETKNQADQMSEGRETGQAAKQAEDRKQPTAAKQADAAKQAEDRKPAAALPKAGPESQENWFVRHKVLTGVLAGVIVVGGISTVSGGGSDSPDTASTDQSQPDATQPEESQPEETGGDAKAMEQMLIDAIYPGKKIDSMCDDAFTHWACFYDGVEDDYGDLQVNLTTDGGWSDDGLDELADDTGRHWFNILACDYPDLNIIIVTINGIDHNVFRSDTPADNIRC